MARKLSGQIWPKLSGQVNYSGQKEFIIIDNKLIIDIILANSFSYSGQISKYLARLLARKNVDFGQKNFSGQITRQVKITASNS